ncbi:AraC family transcriptional regulator [Luteolibacter arcticus]|uniref:AraC family transcriptional regulator n=1 Tax=Luteolibacter arcticus TaxID=1581411 RepID=A0ABT3GK24_9BACT|nr:AraC family transcriptional regulator [Luteolibacter arcticus]MCW1923875.1 AraC family transcriptional regulator [Luteolibacter arcticus]
MAEGFAGQRLLIVPQDRLRRGEALPVIRDLQVTHIGHFNSARNHFVYRRKGCPHFVLIYCLAGAGHCKYRGQTWDIGSGGLILLPPDEAHSYFADAADPWSIFWVHFTGHRAADYVEALALTGDSPLLEVPKEAAMQQAFEETYRHALDGFSESGLLGLTTGLSRLIGLARVYSSSGSARARRTEDRVLTSIRQLQDEPTRDWRIEELAAAAGMSLAHFTDRFHKQAGCPPKQFLIRLRLQIASALMQESGLTVAQIATQVGYEDPYYFSRLFRRHTGQSPRAHRRELGIHMS